MKKNNIGLSISAFLLGTVLIIFAVVSGEQINDWVSGIFYGFGAASFSLGFGGILLKLFLPGEKISGFEKQKKIEVEDERNQMILGKSAVMVNRYMLYILSAFIMIISFSGAQTWLILCSIVLILIQSGLGIFFVDFYNKRM